MSTAVSNGVVVDARPTTVSDDHESHKVKKRWWPGAVCCCLYAVLAMLVFGHFGSLGASHMAGTVSTDDIQQVWWFGWTAFALTHGHDVLLAQWQNYPAGQNFGLQGPMLGIAVLFTPITKIFGPVVSWNIAVRFVFAASASSMCFVLRRWVTWWPAAFVGGLLYGFSAYMLTYASGLLFLTFVALPPVFFLLLHEILVRQKWRPSTAGMLLGVVCFVQFFLGVEVLASMIIIGVIATGLFLLLNHRHLHDTWRYMVRAFLYGGVVGGVLLLAPAAYMVFGPQNAHGSPGFGASGLFPSDLYGAFVPGSQWLSSNGLTKLANTNFVYASAEYIGIPLIAALACFALFLRSRRPILFAGAMAVIAFVLSLGPRLWIDGHQTPVVLPFVLFAHLPVLKGLTAVRFALYTSLFTAVMFAIGLDELRQRLTKRRAPSHLPAYWWRLATVGILAAIVAAVILPLVPSHTQPADSTDIPSFFTTSAIDSVPKGSVLLAYPYPDDKGPDLFYEPPHNIMLDQAASGMRFKLVGGYGWFPSATGSSGTTNPAVLSPSSVEAVFDGAFYASSSESSLLARSHATSDLRAFLRRYGVDTVVLQPEGAEPGAVVRYVTDAIGCPKYSSSVAVWLDVKQRLESDKVPTGK